MSVSHCMGLALKIARKPLGEWNGEVAKLPDSCPHSDCGLPHSCRQRIGTYLAIQREIILDRPRPVAGRR